MNKKKTVFRLVSALIVTSLISSSMSASAAVTSFSKWSDRSQTLYVDMTSSVSIPWSTGAAKWRNSTLFNVSTTISSFASSYNYHAINVYDSSADWDGITNYYLFNGLITDATLNVNTYYTAMPKYTTSVKAALVAHEVGHSLGLRDSSVVETSSIMHPYTFVNSTTVQRPYNLSSSDISVTNGLYPLGYRYNSNHGAHEEKASGYYIHPSWSEYYPNEKALANRADLVVRGIVIGELGSTYTRGNSYSYKTNVNVAVHEVMKGKLQTDQQIRVAQMGGTDDHTQVFVHGSTHLKVGQEVVLFLRQIGTNTYAPINEDDSVYLKTNLTEEKQEAYANIASNKPLNINFATFSAE